MHNKIINLNIVILPISNVIINNYQLIVQALILLILYHIQIFKFFKCFLFADIDECLTANCSVTATCTDLVDGYNCTCNRGFEGDGVSCTSEL